MSQTTPIVNTTAPLTNVQLCMKTMQRATDRPVHLPGMVVFSGPSGFGKSTAAAYVMNKLGAVYVECRSIWSKKSLLAAILQDMQIKPESTTVAMFDQICEYLGDTGKPLIIDEMDHLVEKKSVEIIRDIYEGSGAPIMLIGEERLPKKLKRWERFDGRILHAEAAKPVSIKDVAHLAHLYCSGLQISEDLLIKIHTSAKGSIRRVCVKLNSGLEYARSTGRSSIDLTAWDIIQHDQERR